MFQILDIFERYIREYIILDNKKILINVTILD